MIDLPNVTLLCGDCVNIQRAIATVEHCKSKCNFGAVKLLTSIPTDYPHAVKIMHLGTLLDYSIWMLKRAYQYVDTPYVLTVQHDGFVLNPESWDPNWLNYDYMGPLFQQTPPIPREEHVGSGGFSLRSKKLMQWINDVTPEWRGPEDTEFVQRQLGCYEDGWISQNNRAALKYAGFKFAPALEAAKFAQCGWPQYSTERSHYFERPFGFHGGWTNVDTKTGFVSPPPFLPRGTPFFTGVSDS
jgi:hypothetical protein